jgi:hypothetical protein
MPWCLGGWLRRCAPRLCQSEATQFRLRCRGITSGTSSATPHGPAVRSPAARAAAACLPSRLERPARRRATVRPLSGSRPGPRGRLSPGHPPRLTADGASGVGRLMAGRPSGARALHPVPLPSSGTLPVSPLPPPACDALGWPVGQGGRARDPLGDVRMTDSPRTIIDFIPTE